MFASNPLSSPVSVAQSQASNQAVAQVLPARQDFYTELADSWGELTLPTLDQLIDEPITAVADAAIATVGAVGMFTAFLGKLWDMAWNPKNT